MPRGIPGSGPHAKKKGGRLPAKKQAIRALIPVPDILHPGVLPSAVAANMGNTPRMHMRNLSPAAWEIWIADGANGAQTWRLNWLSDRGTFAMTRMY